MFKGTRLNLIFFLPCLFIMGCGGESGLSEIEAKGKSLFMSKNCHACHTVEANRLVGPGLKGVFGRKVKVKSGAEERELVADENYLVKSIKDPNADVVDGFQSGQMILPVPVSDEEISALIAYLKTLK